MWFILSLFDPLSPLFFFLPLLLLLCRSILEDQINMLKKVSEQKLEALKKEIGPTETELEEVRYLALVAGGQSSKMRQNQQLTEKQAALRHIKERSEAAQLLVQNVIGGLAHIAETLGLPTQEEEAPAATLLQNIEAVLETLMEEREKQQQQQTQQPHGHSQNLSQDSPSRLHSTRETTQVQRSFKEQRIMTHSHNPPVVQSLALGDLLTRLLFS